MKQKAKVSACSFLRENYYTAKKKIKLPLRNKTFARSTYVICFANTLELILKTKGGGQNC
jgi:hypothetical protein